MGLQYKSDNLRAKKIKDALEAMAGGETEWTADELVRAEDLTLATATNTPGGVEIYYAELWSQKCLEALFLKPEYKQYQGNNVRAVQAFFHNRFTDIAQSVNVDIVDYDVSPSDHDNEVVLVVQMIPMTDTDTPAGAMMAEADYLSNRPPGDPRYQVDPMRAGNMNQHNQQQVGQPANQLPSQQPDIPKSDNRFNQVYMSNRAKPQDPKLVDRMLKSVFEEKFDIKYGLSTDVGEWHPVKTMSTSEGKFYVMWTHEKTEKVKIATTFFQGETNKISVVVLGPGDEKIIETYFEIYRIPTDSFLVERFIRKTYFSLMKKFVNAQVIKLEPFRRSFVFWKSNNPYFSYSFSEPKKNQIVLDLIGFIKTAQKPILDDFFEQNNLRHKQGYLQTLLDASEDAGIFEFHRTGNEVLVHKGVNFKAFLEGRIRKS